MWLNEKGHSSWPEASSSPICSLSLHWNQVVISWLETHVVFQLHFLLSPILIQTHTWGKPLPNTRVEEQNTAQSLGFYRPDNSGFEFLHPHQWVLSLHEFRFSQVKNGVNRGSQSFQEIQRKSERESGWHTIGPQQMFTFFCLWIQEALLFRSSFSRRWSVFPFLEL